jgi:hypothetical protein
MFLKQIQLSNSILVAILFSSFFGFSQNIKKKLQTQFTTDKIIIDGKFDEASWQNAAIAKDFVMWEPDNGKPEPQTQKTEVKIVYDNNAIYIAATMYDSEPNKILKELSQRDDSGTVDRFGVFINGFNDGQQEFSFMISAAGVQEDFLFTESNGEDSTWNAIWESKTKITANGWVAEIKIPYAAIRFSDEKKQTWGINFIRDFKRERQFYTWNLIDAKISSRGNQEGLLEGIENIKTPTRLFFIPYSSFYLNANENQKTKGQLKGGLDIKYGVNDAFTLDAILVPDFGQTAFDNVVFNLGPFEQQFSENRPFFSEGTELFSKGDLVYSRRIGGSPTIPLEVNADESVTEYPSKVNLLNALKVSGRTKDGLGVGILNAVTDKTKATIQNNTTGEIREALIEPLANYNVLVLDQRFRTNSSVSFVNTNVTRNGSYRDANVSALLFDLNTKKNTYNLSGDYKASFVNDFGNSETKKGYSSSIYFGETSGKFRFGGGGEYVSANFDKDDLGIQFQDHYHAINGNASFRILKPNKTFNSFSTNLNLYSQFDNNTGRVQSASYNLNFNTTNKKNDYCGFGLSGRPIVTYDFYEPRSNNDTRFLAIPRIMSGFIYFSSNYNRKFALDVNPSIGVVDEKDRINYGISIEPRYRFSNKFSLIYSFNFFRQNNDIGYAATSDTTNEIFMGRRDRVTYTNTIQGKLSLNDLMNFNLAVRHYWSYADYHQYYALQNDGTLAETTSYTGNRNENFNTWNLDLSYSWWFAPGSQLSVLYRNNAGSLENEIQKDFGSNIKNVINHSNLDHILSVSIRYFIDYNSLKSKNKV